MFIGAYLLGAILIYLLSLLVTAAARTQALRFSAFAAVSVVMGLILFIALSVWMGLLTIGTESSYSIPADYVEQGLSGVLTLAVGFVGMLSPLFIALWLRRTR